MKNWLSISKLALVIFAFPGDMQTVSFSLLSSSLSDNDTVFFNFVGFTVTTLSYVTKICELDEFYIISQ